MLEQTLLQNLLEDGVQSQLSPCSEIREETRCTIGIAGSVDDRVERRLRGHAVAVLEALIASINVIGRKCAFATESSSRGRTSTMTGTPEAVRAA